LLVAALKVRTGIRSGLSWSAHPTRDIGHGKNISISGTNGFERSSYSLKQPHTQEANLMTYPPCQTSSPRNRRMERNRFSGRTIAAVLLLFTLLGAACGGGFDNADTSADFSVASDAADGMAMEEFDSPEALSDAGDDFEVAAAAEEAPADTDRGSDAAGFATTGAAGSEATAQLPDLGRDIIFTASLEIASTNVPEATRQAIQSIEGRGGFLFSQETRGGAGGTSVLTFKVLPEHFQAALNDLGAVGEVRSQSISADDVSAVVVDLESRINTAEASVMRLRNLLDDASELETIATLENQLLQRETSLEQLRGQLRTVRNQVDLATITVVVSELSNRPGLALEAMSYEGHDGGFGCFDTSSVRSIIAGDPLTVCYRLTNTGDTPLVDISIDDAVLGASVGSVVVVDGSITQIDPGASLLVAHETELSEAVRVRTSVTATGLDADGNEIDTVVQATAATMRFDIIDTDDGIPGFGEVLANSWNALVTAAVVIALLAVAVAPFVAVALLVGVPIWKVIKRQRRAQAAARAAQPAPPAPPAPPTEDPADASSDKEAAITS